MSASTSTSELHSFSWPKTGLGVRFGLPLLIFCWLSPLLFAQFNSSLEGTITDASGAAVPDIAVDIVNEATGVSSKTRTAGNGYFYVPSLAPSHYRVEAAKPDLRSRSNSSRSKRPVSNPCRSV